MADTITARAERLRELLHQDGIDVTQEEAETLVAADTYDTALQRARALTAAER